MPEAGEQLLLPRARHYMNILLGYSSRRVFGWSLTMRLGVQTTWVVMGVPDA